MKTRAFVLALVAVAASAAIIAGVVVKAVFLAPGSSATARPANFKEVGWDDLVPKDWDPLKRFRDMNLGTLDDANPRAQELLRDMRATWDNAPTVAAMDGAAIRLPGYVVPLEETPSGLKEFLLVPYFGACIHTPPPPANQIVHVIVTNPAKGFHSMDTVWVSGTMKTGHQDSPMGTSAYQMQAAALDAYVPVQRP